LGWLLGSSLLFSFSEHQVVALRFAAFHFLLWDKLSNILLMLRVISTYRVATPSTRAWSEQPAD